jgi:signal transduction histidine kinase
MKQYSYRLSSLEHLNEILNSPEITSSCKSPSQLVQIYSAKNDCEWYKYIGDAIRKVIPSVVIVGATSVGEIIAGEMCTDSTIVLFTFFESSSVDMFAYECTPGTEETIGNILICNIASVNAEVKGVLLLSTPISHDSGKIFNSITDYDFKYPIFGGGAGDYANQRKTLVYDGKKCYKQGVVAVIFSGNDLQIEIFTSLGWHALSKEMTITEVGDTCVKTIDNKPAFDVYEKYLGIKADENFYQNSLEFPFLISRNDQLIARTPFFVNETDKSIQLVADVQVGEKFRIGYGDPVSILIESAQLQSQMRDFKPEAIFLYTCICRRFLMQQEVDLETLPFNKIASTAGFYTFGEFYSNGTFNSLLNSSIVAVGFREGVATAHPTYNKPVQNTEMRENSESDPYTNKHARILSRLLYFITVLTKELDDQNQLLQTLNEQKNEFLGIAAHDLRNPIGVILGISNLLEKQTGEEHKKYTEIISGTSSTMLQLINDLLDISKIESGKLDLKKNETDYIAFIKRNVKMNDYFAQNKNIGIVSEFGMENQLLSFDDGKIDQVLNNLIGNAIKYSNPDTTITVKVFKEENKIVTQIMDNGQGIPEQEINDIFKPFKRTSVKPTSGESSHGLGLAIVKKIVEGHNGEVGVSSVVGKGSNFYFTLPI